MKSKNPTQEQTTKWSKYSPYRTAIFVGIIVLFLVAVIYIISALNYDAINDPDPILEPPKDTARLSIEAVWNNNSRVSFVIRNAGIYTFSTDEVKQISIHVDDTQIDIPEDCINYLNGAGTVCRIDTDVDFPTVLGSDGEIIIEVKPPFGTGDAYSCMIPSSKGTHKTC